MALVFIGLLVTVFLLLWFATGPSSRDRVLGQRLLSLRARDLHAPGTNAENAALLIQDPDAPPGTIENLLQGFAFGRLIRTYVAQARTSRSVTFLGVTSAVLALSGCVIAAYLAPALPVEIAAACLFGALPVWWIVWKRGRELRAFNSVLPDAIDMMARALHAGHSLSSAFEMVAQDCPAPVGPAFAELFRQQNFGLPLRQALMRMLEGNPSYDLRVLITAFLVQRETGGNLIEVLDRTAFLIRERMRIQGEVHVHTAQGRMTGWILCLLPVFLLTATNFMNPGYAQILLTDPTGRKLIYVGVGLLTLGTVSIHRIIRGIEV